MRPQIAPGRIDKMPAGRHARPALSRDAPLPPTTVVMSHLAGVLITIALISGLTATTALLLRGMLGTP